MQNGLEKNHLKKVMPIPDFNEFGVLPPYLEGNPQSFKTVSPYPATSLEVCQRFGFSQQRQNLLRKWLFMRSEMRRNGFESGFQWLAGSFTEDVERDKRSPSDLDVVSFLPEKPSSCEDAFYKVISDRDLTEKAYKIHHILIHLNIDGEALVEKANMYCGLLSHRKIDDRWKGRLRVDLNTFGHDQDAGNFLDKK